MATIEELLVRLKMVKIDDVLLTDDEEDQEELEQV